MTCCTDQNEKSGKKCYLFLFSCCVFWFILTVILASVLVFVGRHLLFNSVFNQTRIVQQSFFSEFNYKRLPSDVRPELYNLTLLPYLDKNYFEGHVNITLEVSNPKSEIAINSKLLTVFSVTLELESGKEFEVLSITENKREEVLVITPKRKVFPGRYFLTVGFRGESDKLVGLYKSRYRSGNETRTIATSKFEPTYARQAFPCFDEPNMKAKYIVHLLKPKKPNYIALSNYPVQKIESYDAENDLVTFEETVSMSTYLTCFIVSDFTYTRTTFNNSGTETELRVYASPGNLEKTKYAGEVAKKVIEYYIDYFGIPYPLPKLDMVAIPDFVSGAMEHWGLVTYRETALLYTNTTHSSANKQRVATVIAHELAHSWFGNLVTMDWWNDLWLNEGFASYIEFKGTDAAEPSWQMLSQFQISDLHPVLTFDASVSSHPIVTKVETPDHITEIFDLISYNKGASILRMLEDTVGPENFRKGVTNYLNKYRFGNAVTRNFLDEIQAVVGPSINIYEMMDTYTVQMGFPVVSVQYDPSSKKYTLTQKRFLKDPKMQFDSNSTTYGYRWTIPINYVTDQGKSERPIFFPYNESRITIEKPKHAKWLKFNYDQVGYYRVNYELSEWKRLIDIYDSLSVTDRTHLLEECFSLAAAGLLSYDVPLDLTKQLSNETDYAPWSVASSQLKRLSKHLKDTKYSSMLENYIRRLVSNAYQIFTWNESFEDSHLTKLTRSEVLSLACHANLEDCLSQVKEKFDKWIEDPSQTLSPDLRAVVYKYGMTKADEDTWNKMLSIYKQENDAQEKVKLMAGLGNVRNSSILIGLLELVKDESLVRGQDYFSVLNMISSNPLGTDLVWDYVRQNWEYLVNRFTLNDRYLGTMIRTVTSQFSTQEKLSEMKEFFAKYPEAGAGAAARKTALENVQNNIVWLENYKAVIERWIEKLNEN